MIEDDGTTLAVAVRLELAMEILRSARALAIKARDDRTISDLQGAMSKLGAAMSRYREGAQ